MTVNAITRPDDSILRTVLRDVLSPSSPLEYYPKGTLMIDNYGSRVKLSECYRVVTVTEKGYNTKGSAIYVPCFSAFELMSSPCAFK